MLYQFRRAVFSLVRGTPWPTYDVLLAGNSIPAGLFDLPFQAKLAAALGLDYGMLENIAVSGQSTPQMLRRDLLLITQRLAWRPGKLLTGTRPTVLLAWEGTNDLYYMSREGAMQGQQAFAHTKAYFHQVKAAHPALRTVTGTILPRTDPGLNHVTFAQEQQVYNALLRQAAANKEPWLDALADVAADLELIAHPPHADGSGSLYFHDYVHLSEAGLDRAIPYFAQAITTVTR